MNELMFDRPDLKQRAKKALSGHWGTAVLITLIATIFGVLNEYSTIRVLIPQMGFQDYLFRRGEYFQDLVNQGAAGGNPFSVQQLILFFVVILAMGVLIQGIYQLAMYMWFMKTAQDQSVGIGDFFGYFSEGVSGALLFLWTQLWLLIWILPGLVLMALGGMLGMTFFMILGVLVMLVLGIYKQVQYSFAFYALADEPSIGVRKALRASIQVVKGNMGQVIVLYLSFLLWILLTAFIPIAALFVVPYITTTIALAWLQLRNWGFDHDRLQPQDFGMEAVLSTSAAATVDTDIIEAGDATETVVPVPVEDMQQDSVSEEDKENQ